MDTIYDPDSDHEGTYEENPIDANEESIEEPSDTGEEPPGDTVEEPR